jgi:hypothetical protein
MMTSDIDEKRGYVARKMQKSGLAVPASYVSMLARTPPDRVIEGLSPWFFLPDPALSVGYCTEALGRPVLPFAQAVGEDSMACFLGTPRDNPSIVVINPWSDRRGPAIIRAELADYDAWLVYAHRISSEVSARDADQESDD